MARLLSLFVRDREERPVPTVQNFIGVFGYTRRALGLVWRTSPMLTLALAGFSLLEGAVPQGMAVIGKWIVDGVIGASKLHTPAAMHRVIGYVEIEFALVVLLMLVQRGITVYESLLRALLGQKVNEMILEKALELELQDFEDSEFYDRMTRARREASSRPLSLVKRVFVLESSAIALIAQGVLLIRFSLWAPLFLIVASLPSFIAETRFSADAFRLFRWRAPESRMQMYLETVLAREDSAKEVKLFQIGPTLLDRYRAIFRELFREDRALTLRRGIWGVLLGLLSTVAFYATYAWIVVSAIGAAITLGDMTMYVALFRSGQSKLTGLLGAIGGMYEDNLYISNLYEYLEHPTRTDAGKETKGPTPGDGIRFEHVSFRYPSAKEPAVDDVSLHLYPGRKLALVGENGAGKTTLIKLLTRLYRPTDGRILLDGLPLDEWDAKTLQRRVGVIFQDYVRYQLLAGENIGVGDVQAFADETRWKAAAGKGMADEFLERLPGGYRTQLGGWFKGGQELSLGQWQKVALSRAFMRNEADILVLDEPTSSMDAEAEATVFERFRELSDDRMLILISHRFSTVRMAEQIIVLERGRIIEQGSHEELVGLGGKYARLFHLQAMGYR